MRAGNPLTGKGIYEFGGFRLDTSERVIESAGRPLSIAPKALDVLILLVEHRGRIVEKDDLMRLIWPDTFVEENNLAFNISVLRKLLGESAASPRYIETVSKRGYRFIAEVTEVPGNALPVTEPSAEVPRIGRTARRRYFLTAVFLLALILALIGILAFRYHRTPKLTLAGTIVLADFINKTGDPVFDGPLDQGLAIELQQSPSLSVVPAGRLRRTLDLIGRRADTRLTPELARQVCERTASVAVLEGSIAKLGSQYVLGLRARSCVSGDLLDDEQVQVARKEDVLNALGRIAGKFRIRFGESLAMLTKHDIPLAEATTPSLEALKAYTAGLKLHSSNGALAALPLFRRAVEIDPEFAMAHAYMGRVYANLDESELASQSIAKAWQLRDRMSDRERFAVTVRYHALLTGNLEEVRQTSEAWTQNYPRDPQPYIGLALYNQAIGQYEKAAAQAGKGIEADPDFGPGYAALASNRLRQGQLREAGDVLRSAAERGLQLDDFLMLRYDLAFLKDDLPGMQREAALARQRPAGDNWISNREAFALAYSGRLQQARSMSRRAVDQALGVAQRERAGLWEAGAAAREAFFGNPPEARKRALAALELSRDREVEFGAAFALAQSGDSSRAQALADDLERRFPDDTAVRYSYLPAVRARLALNLGDAPKALELLQAAAPYELGAHPAAVHALFGALYEVYVRGQADLALHRASEAAGEFRKILDRRGIVLADPVGALARLQLGRSLCLARDRTGAKTAYQDFLLLWKNADPDMPVLKQAKAEYAAILK